MPDPAPATVPALTSAPVATEAVRSPRLLIVGGGKMGEALLGGLLAQGWCEPHEVVVVEPDPERAQALAERYAVKVAASLDQLAAAPVDGTIVAVKPQHVAGVCTALRDRTARILSIAAGVRIAAIESALGDAVATGATAVVRAMPNTPALVGLGAAAIAPGTTAGADDLAWASSILSSVGVVALVSEAQLDAITGLSGSGPAYVFLLAEALTEAGVLNGLPRDVCAAFAAQTIRGAAEMLVATGREPAALRADVTSPGGTTAAGLRVLEERAVRGAVLAAVSAATERSRELGNQ